MDNPFSNISSAKDLRICVRDNNLEQSYEIITSLYDTLFSYLENEYSIVSDWGKNIFKWFLSKETLKQSSSEEDWCRYIKLIGDNNICGIIDIYKCIIDKKDINTIIKLSKTIFNNGITSHNNIFKNYDIINTCTDIINMINALEYYYNEIKNKEIEKEIIKTQFKKKLLRLRPSNKRKLNTYNIGEHILASYQVDKKLHGAIIIKILESSYIVKWDNKTFENSNIEEDDILPYKEDLDCTIQLNSKKRRRSTSSSFYSTDEDIDKKIKSEIEKVKLDLVSKINFEIQTYNKFVQTELIKDLERNVLNNLKKDIRLIKPTFEEKTIIDTVSQLFKENCNKWLAENVEVVNSYNNLNSILTNKIHETENLTKKFNETGEAIRKMRKSIGANMNARNRNFDKTVDDLIKSTSEEFNKFMVIKNNTLVEIENNKKSFLEKVHSLVISVKNEFKSKIDTNIKILTNEMAVFDKTKDKFNLDFSNIKKDINFKISKFYTSMLNYKNNIAAIENTFNITPQTNSFIQ